LNSPSEDKSESQRWRRPNNNIARQGFTRAVRFHRYVFVLILAVGIFERTWEFGQLPPGLNPDEASTGVEAFNLLKYGTDRNGVAYPVKFISWGSGQDVLYSYLLVPWVALMGLSPSVLRLPMLGSGIIALPLLYVVVKRLLGMRPALWAMFMLSICPWHILLSRWALDSNLFPLVFLAGFACLLHIQTSGWWFSAACAFFALCLYAYGTAYAVVPIFLACSLIIIYQTRLLRARHFALGIVCFAVLSFPIALLILINRFGLSTVSLGPIGIPGFPVPVRWETTTLIGSSDMLGTLAANVRTGMRLLVVETDGILYNAIDPFGYFYRVGFTLALAGLVVLFHQLRTNARYETLLLLAWLGAGLAVMFLQAVNINRFNIIFFPIIILGACALDWLQLRYQTLGLAAASLLTAAFLAFTMAYHGEPYRRQIDSKFQKGLLPAIEFARGLTKGAICVTDKINMPYIYALFVEHTSPAEFQSSVMYADGTTPMRQVASFGRYRFGVRNCGAGDDLIYVLRADEMTPRLGNRYSYEFFDNFVVYYPTP
jgi:hypothetical protein